MNDAHDNARADRDALERYGDTLTHAVTIHQPLAWAVAAGHCPVVPSDTRPGLAHEGKLIGIHASRKLIRHGWIHGMPGLAPAFRSIPGFDRLTPADCAVGALIGVARLVGICREWHGTYERMLGAAVGNTIDPEYSALLRPWWRTGSKWGLMLRGAVLLPEPIQMRGAGGVWRLPNRLLSHPAMGHDRVLPATGWALEQWRKARASR